VGQEADREALLIALPEQVEELDDGWTLRPEGRQPTVQYEHTLVATRNGPVILTLT
jgi:methionine aminopeptidase